MKQYKPNQSKKKLVNIFWAGSNGTVWLISGFLEQFGIFGLGGIETVWDFGIGGYWIVWVVYNPKSM